MTRLGRCWLRRLTGSRRLTAAARRDSRARARLLPKAHLHLHFTGAMRHATLIELARDARYPPAGGAVGAEWPPRLLGDRRARAGSGSSGSTTTPARSSCAPEPTCAGCIAEGAEDEAAEGSRLAGDPGRPERVRRPVRRADGVHRPGAGRAADAVAGDRSRHRRWSSRPTGPGTRSTPGPSRGSRPSTPGAGSSGSACPTTSGAASRADFARGLPDRRPGRACSPSRTAASWSARAAYGPAWTSWRADRIGHGVRAVEDPDVLRQAVADRAVTLEVCPASNVALGVVRPTRRRAAARAARRPASGSRSAPTTRCCSGRGWPRSTSWPGGCTAAPTRISPAWPACRCRVSGPRAGRRACSRASAGWPARRSGAEGNPALDRGRRP